MPRHASTGVIAALGLSVALPTGSQAAEMIAVVPDQTSHIRLSNRDVNHVLCVGGEIEDVKFSAEKGLAVERGGSDAWIKFLVREMDDLGTVSRDYVTTPSEFFVTCNEAVYPLYAEPSDIPAQTVTLLPGTAQRSRANEALLGPLVEEERAVSIILSLLQDRVPASFSEVAPRKGPIALPSIPDVSLIERRRLSIDGAGLSASEYLVEARAATRLDERQFLDGRLGADIFAITLSRLDAAPGATSRLVVVRRGSAQ